MHFKITSNCHLSGGMVVSIITITLLQISKLLLSSDLKSSRHGKNVKSVVMKSWKQFGNSLMDWYYLEQWLQIESLYTLFEWYLVPKFQVFT